MPFVIHVFGICFFPLLWLAFALSSFPFPKVIVFALTAIWLGLMLANLSKRHNKCQIERKKTPQPPNERKQITLNAFNTFSIHRFGSDRLASVYFASWLGRSLRFLSFLFHFLRPLPPVFPSSLFSSLSFRLCQTFSTWLLLIQYFRSCRCCCYCCSVYSLMGSTISGRSEFWIYIQKWEWSEFFLVLFFLILKKKWEEEKEKAEIIYIVANPWTFSGEDGVLMTAREWMTTK